MYNRFRNNNLKKFLEEVVLVFPKKVFKSNFLLTLLKKKKVTHYSLEDAYVLKSYYRKRSTQANKILSSFDEFFFYLILNKVRNFIAEKRAPLPSNLITD